MNSASGRTLSEVRLLDTVRYPPVRSYMSSYEVSRFVQRCQKEREDALRREESSRDKLKCLEVSSRSQIQELKAKLKEVTNENKALHRTVKKLRLDLGLEGNPKFRGKMTKDIIKELHEQEDQCSQMKEENQILSVQLREMVPIIVQTQKQKAELQAQLEGMESKIWDLSNKNTQLSQLLEETQKERDDLEKAYLMYKKSVEDTKKITSRSVQTVTSIPVILQTTYKKVSRESSSSQASQVGLEKRKVSLDTSNSPPITADIKQKTYLRTARNQS